MKHIVYTTILSLTFGLLGTSVHASIDASEVRAISPQEIEVTFSENPNLRVGEVEAEVKILRDISIRGGFTWKESSQVELILEDPLLPNTNYSLLSIIWADGSIDFKTSDELDDKTIMNLSRDEQEDIKSITIVNSRTVLIDYIQDLSETEFEYKLLAESRVESIENKAYDDSKIFIRVDPPLLAEQNYILMILDMQDVDGIFLDFELWIYDFSTPPGDEWIEYNTQDIAETADNLITEEEINENEISIPEVRIVEEEFSDNLESAGEEISLEKNINSVAQTVGETPDTGAETWILILLSLVINSFYHLSRRKKQVFA